MCVLAALLACALPLALRGQKKQPRGPRAIAVVAWTSDRATPNVRTSVLTPIAILAEGRYYDANLYLAQPMPLALDSGVIYDVLKNGDPIGTFTVGGALDKNDAWYGTGLFQDKSSAAPQSAKGGPLTLHSRNGGKAPESTSNSAAADDRPRLRRGPPPPQAPQQQTDSELASIDRDPNRPKLHRETEGEIQQEKAQQKKAEAANPQAILNDSETHMLAAVSDAHGPEEHSFVFHYKDNEKEDLRSAMEKLARSELARSGVASEGPKTSARKSTRQQHSQPLGGALEDVHFAAFDVNTDNAPIVVYSATAMVNDKKKYITVAAWEEIDESLRKIFAQVTDDAHLDVYPRLELVDALDADGNGRGDLLFRAIGDQGSRFVLYHPGPDSLDLLFDSSRAESRR
jgi:hypothetical protein